jgi:RNA polymerase sigma factor (sigma-70 family)
MYSDHFEEIVSQHYESLYRFALSLTQTEADACDLTQQAFYIWATKGHQLRDRSKVKSWLFTILHREFLQLRKRAIRFPHFELSDANDDLPAIEPEPLNTLDAAWVLAFLGHLPEPCRAALILFYMEDHSYKEIADILQVPIGTVRSRISRGMAQLQRSILVRKCASPQRAISAPDIIPSKYPRSERSLLRRDPSPGLHSLHHPDAG